MKVLIIEDELPAAERLQNMIAGIDESIQVLGILESVALARRWFSEHALPDLIFADIHLSDGLSFEIFDSLPAHCPIIFTTSYDAYALKAFKVKSIDYLLKPLKTRELEDALNKFKDMGRPFEANEYALRLESLADTLLINARKYKTCFLVKFGDQLLPVHQKHIAYFHYCKRLVCMVRLDGTQHLTDHSMEELNVLLDPSMFFHANRQFIIHLSSVTKIHIHFNGALKLELSPKPEEEVIVSREKAKAFREWMEQSVS